MTSVFPRAFSHQKIWATTVFFSFLKFYFIYNNIFLLGAVQVLHQNTQEVTTLNTSQHSPHFVHHSSNNMVSDSNEEQQAKPKTAWSEKEKTDTNAGEGTVNKFSPRIILLTVEIEVLAFVVPFMSTVLVCSLPQITEDHPDDTKLVAWILTATLLIGALFTPVIGGLLGIFPLHVVAAIPMIMYNIGLFGSGIFGYEVMPMVIFRGFQGFGTPLFIVLYDIIKKKYPPKFVTSILGLTNAMNFIGASIGLLGGAALTSVIRYDRIFFIPAPIVAICCVAILLTIAPISRDCLHCKKNKIEGEPPFKEKAKKTLIELAKIDWIGVLLVAAGTVLFLVGLTNSETWHWKNAKTLCFVIIGVVILIAWVLFELWISHPLVPMRLLFRRDLFFLTLVAFFVGFAMYAVFQGLPYLLTSPLLDFQYTKQFQIGLLMFESGVLLLPIAPVVGGLCRVVGASLLQTTAIVVSLVGFIPLIWKHYTVAQVIILNMIQGVGVGCTLVSQMGVLSNSCTKEEFGGATSVNAFFRTLGSAISPVVVAILLEDTITVDYYGTAYEITKTSAYTKIFIMGAVVMGVALICAMCVSGHAKILNIIWNKVVAKRTEKQEIELEEFDTEAQNESETQVGATPSPTPVQDSQVK